MPAGIDCPAVDLTSYLFKHGLTEVEFAERCGVDQPTINRIRSGARKSSLAVALRIEQVTGGEVTADELPMTDWSRRMVRALRADRQKAPA